MSATAFLIFLVLTAPPQSTSLHTDPADTEEEEEERTSCTGARKEGRT